MAGWINRLSKRQHADDIETDGCDIETDGCDIDDVDSAVIDVNSSFRRLQNTDSSRPGLLNVTDGNLDSGVHSMTQSSTSSLTNQAQEEDESFSVLRDMCTRITEEPEASDKYDDVCTAKTSEIRQKMREGMLAVTHLQHVPQVPQIVQQAFSEFDLTLQKLMNKWNRTLRPSEEVNPLMTELYRRDNEQNTLLHWAIVLELVDVALSLIKRTYPPQLLDLRNDLRQTPLILAALTKQSVVVRALAKAGANLALVDRHGDSVYHIAASHGDLDTLIVLSTSVNDRLLSVINTHNNDGLCPVHLAAIAGHTHVLSYLHKIGADMNRRDGKTGYTPLHHAIRKHRDMSEDLMKHLVENVNVDLSTEDYSERTPLMLADGYRCFKTVEYLVNHGPGREWLYCPPVSSEDSSESEFDDDEDMGFAEV